MNNIDENEIDGIEAIDLELYVKPIPTHKFKVKGTITSITEICPDCGNTGVVTNYCFNGMVDSSYSCHTCKGA